jgi:hypothetical protein
MATAGTNDFEATEPAVADYQSAVGGGAAHMDDFLPA